MRQENRIIWAEHVVVLIIGFVLVVGLLYKTGTFTSGYHFADDHELIRMELEFEKQNTLGSVMKSMISGDMTQRFRPLYWVERVTGARIWGSDMLAWNYYTAWKGVVTFYLLYLVARFLRNGRVISIFFPCVIMFGTQFTPWYRSANQESTGMLLCAFTLLLIAGQAYYRKYTSWIYNIGIVAGAVLCGLMKESFTLFVPVFIALKYWLEYCDKKVQAPDARIWTECVKTNWPTYAAIGVAFLSNILIIMLRVGVDKIDYAGFHEETSLSEYLSGLEATFTYYQKWCTLFAVLILFVVAMCYQLIEKDKIKYYIGFALIGFFAMAVQLVVHAKSGMWERYALPCMVGYAFVFVLLGYRIFEQDVARRRIYLAILSLLLCLQVPKGYQLAKDYTYTGTMIRNYFQCILDHTDETSLIISGFSDAEINIATECWLEVRERTQVTSWQEAEFVDNVQLVGEAPDDVSWQQAKVATCYTSQQGEILQLMGLTDPAQYFISECGHYCVIVRK